MTLILSEDKQETILDRSLKTIKARAYQLHKSIEKNSIRQSLRETYLMLNELRTNDLTPKNYYHLFTTIFDEMLLVENFFKEQIERGRDVREIYEGVQEAKHLIPRLYMMISAGALVLEKEPKCSEEIIFDLLGMVKGVQNPTRGLFTRYFLLKRIKDKLPDNGNKYLEEGGKFEDTLNFLIQNMDEMNQLWIRISADKVGPEKKLRNKERVELKILVGESINRLSSLDGLTIEIYEKEVLPKIVQIILDSGDPLSQQYLVECIIHAFPDTYNIKCIELILNTLSKLLPEVDIKGLFISLMEKLEKFITHNSGKDSSEENKKLISSATSVYPILIQYFDRLQKESFILGSEMDICKLFDLNTSFTKFAITCEEIDVLAGINHVLSSTLLCLKQYNRLLSNDGIKKLNRLLETPLESEYSLFDMTDFLGLVEYLNYFSKKNLCLNIIKSLCKPGSKNKINSIGKVQKILELIKPLLEDSENDEEEDIFDFENEQSEVCKLIYIVKSRNPKIVYQIYDQFKKVFIKGGERRMKITLPALANSIILFCHKITCGYDNKAGLITAKEKKRNNYIKESIKTFDIRKIESDEVFHKLMLDIYKLLNEIISLICQTSPESAFKLYLTSASQVNSIKSYRQNFEESCVNFINAAITIYQEGKYNQNLKYYFLSDICGYLLKFSVLSKENLENIIKIIMEYGTKLSKRGEQFNTMINIGKIYLFALKDGKKVIECINKARRFADFAMINPQNLILFVDLLNNYLYFVDHGDEIVTIKAEQINDIIDLINNQIETIKNEMSAESNFLPEIENYFNKTIKMIQKIKKTKEHKPIYDELLNN